MRCACSLLAASPALLLPGLAPAPRAARAPPSCASAARAWWPQVQGPFDLPAADRATLRREIVPGEVWSLEQVQGVIYVHVPVRMMVTKIRGGLFAYSVVAPTNECLRLLSELEAEHGPLTHILLPTLALEHKSFAAPFARARPDAQLWVAPGQYSFPLDLPAPLLGFPFGTKVLPAEWSDDAAPWAAELRWWTLGPLREKVGGYAEMAVYHLASSTLLLTDLLASVPSVCPEIVALNDVRAPLFHARSVAADRVSDAPATRDRGWSRIALFALYFKPGALKVINDPADGDALAFWSTAFPKEVPACMRDLGWAGFWPFEWDVPQASAAFTALARGGELVVPPILQVTILNRDPSVVLDFAERVAAECEPFRRGEPCTVVTAHFDAPATADRDAWLAAFTFLRGEGSSLPERDLAFLRELDRQLVEGGTVRSPAVFGPPEYS